MGYKSMNFFSMEETSLIRERLNNFIEVIDKSRITFNKEKEEHGVEFSDELSKIFEAILNRDYANNTQDVNKNPNMTKENIYRAMYGVIEESMEWGSECDNKEYFHYVDGVRAMTEELVNQIDNSNKVD